MCPLAVAQHEAAHVVVGVALGLRLRRATAQPSGRDLGWAWFDGRARPRDVWAWALMYAAGIAWDEAVGDAPSPPDVAEVRRLAPRSRRACVAAAGALLAARGAAHARVTRALLEGDVTGADIEVLASGARRVPRED